MTKSLQYVLMIQNISTSLTTKNLHLTASLKFDAFLKTVSITNLIVLQFTLFLFLHNFECFSVNIMLRQKE